MTKKKNKQDWFGRSKGDFAWRQKYNKNRLRLMYIVSMYIYIINMNCVKNDRLIYCTSKVIQETNYKNGGLNMRGKGGKVVFEDRKRKKVR